MRERGAFQLVKANTFRADPRSAPVVGSGCCFRQQQNDGSPPPEPQKTGSSDSRQEDARYNVPPSLCNSSEGSEEERKVD